ncbi:MAG: DUF1232 domain-containing protein [Tissierellia bacterium]|nr:DUF1232 domain-containing protein [Tissierellia bacterium]MDD4780315.1 DUF1232 domain-containing protein [Tissierellia bacterium]
MNLFLKISILFKFIFDKKIPLKEKLWIIVPAIYLLSPVDLIPEPILGFGIVDDIIILGFLISLINKKTNEYYNSNDSSKKYYNHKNDIRNEKIIENVEYEVHDEEDK